MRRSTHKFKKGLVGVCCAFALTCSVGVQATLLDGIVDIWNVDVETVFDTATAVFTPGSGGTSVSASSLRWGTTTGFGQSGLDITGSPANANVVTNGAAVPNVTVTHLNRPITGNSLDSVNIDSTLTLTPFSPVGVALPSATITFQINFEETPNSASPCANGGANGVGVNVNGCADIFVIDQSALNFPFFYDLGLGFGPKLYFISFFEASSALNSLSAAACAAVGVAFPCIGFQTPERQDTSFRFAALITTERVTIHVPEPGTTASIAIALLALGLVGRRRRKS